MDTETFLLERHKLVLQLQARRVEALEGRSTGRRFLGFTWGDWARLALGAGNKVGFTSWAPKLVFTTAIPILLGVLNRKSTSFITSRKSPWTKLLSFLPLSRFGL